MKVYIVTRDFESDYYGESYSEYNVFVGAYGSMDHARAAIMEMTTEEKLGGQIYERTVNDVVEISASVRYPEVVSITYDSRGTATATYDIVVCEI